MKKGLFYTIGRIIACVSNKVLKAKVSGKNKFEMNIKTIRQRKCKVEVTGTDNTIVLHDNVELENCTIFMNGNGCYLEIGPRSVLKNTFLWIEDDGSSVKIGEKFKIEGGHIASTEGKSIKIGDNCMFSNNIEIRNGDSHVIIDIDNNERCNYAKDVVIGDNCWICANAKLLKGAIVPDWSVISNSALVVKELPEKNSVYVGCPAKLLRKGVKWEISRQKWIIR